MNPKRLIISRTDSIGDVVLTLPLAGIIKEKFPECTILFLGKTYTQPVVQLSKYVDEFVNWDDVRSAKNPIEVMKKLQADTIIHVFPYKEIALLANKANIPTRIGTFGRSFHVLTCNKKVFFSRKKSNLHEAQLNTKLLLPLGIDRAFSNNDLTHYYGFNSPEPLSEELASFIDPNKFNLILHPKSKGSAKEWGLTNFSSLISLLPQDQFNIFISGTVEEGALIGNELPFDQPNVVSLIGKLTLNEFISFIHHTDGMVAASTGPLHIAAALGKTAIGLYSPKKPIHPGRWSPIGPKAQAVVFNPNCETCEQGANCDCIRKISPQTIMDLLR